MAAAMAALLGARKALNSPQTRRALLLGQRALSTEAASPLTALSEEETMFKDTGRGGGIFCRSRPFAPR